MEETELPVEPEDAEIREQTSDTGQQEPTRYPMNLLKLILACSVAGIVAWFTTSVFYIFLVSLLVFIVLFLIIVVKVLSAYNEATSQ